MESALNGSVGPSGLSQVRQWIAMIKLLQENEPRFLLMRINEATESKKPGINASLQMIFDWVREWSDGLDDLEENETRQVEESGNLVEIPVEPDSHESNEAFILTEAIYAIEAVLEMSETFIEDSSDLIDKMQEQRDTREARQSLWESWDKEQSQNDRQAETEDEEEDRPFDIADFFSDL
jgi:hypothetical protein